MTLKIEQIWGILRILLGWTFLWAFFDKVFGLGFATAAENAWIVGGSPTSGFLQFATKGPLAGVFQAMSGSIAIDALFMLGLLLLGLSLISGIGVKIAGYAGALLMFLMWLAVLPPEHNPIVDDHIIYIFILLAFTRVKVGKYLGLGNWWSETGIVKKHPILE